MMLDKYPLDVVSSVLTPGIDSSEHDADGVCTIIENKIAKVLTSTAYYAFYSMILQLKITI